MAATLTDIFRVLKEIAAQLSQPRGGGGGAVRTAATDVSGIESRLDTTNTNLTSVINATDELEGFTDQIESFLNLIEGAVDGLEALQSTTNTNLVTIDGRVDGLEALITTTNNKLDTLDTSVQEVSTNTDPADAGSALVSAGNKLADILASVTLMAGGALVSGGISVGSALVSGGIGAAAHIATGLISSGASVLISTTGSRNIADVNLDILDQLENASGGVSGLKEVTQFLDRFSIRPATDEVVDISGIRILNNHTSARTAEFFFTDGSTRSRMFPIGSIPGGSEITLGSSFHNDHVQKYRIRRDKYIEIDFSGTANSNNYDITYAWDNIVGTTDPTFLAFGP